MITLEQLAALAHAHADDLAVERAPLRVRDREFSTSVPAVMGCVNLSRDSTYRDSIAPSVESAIRKGRVLAAQGADIVDIGAESTTLRAARVSEWQQIDSLTPVVSALAQDGVLVSAETYEPSIARACLEAGATVLNFTGADHQAEMFDLAAEFGSTVICCYVPRGNVREVGEVELDVDPMPGLLAHFGPRIEAARAAGVESIVIDPGMGFYYSNLVDPPTRMRHQTQVIAASFRLHRLGVPICQALPHAFDAFEDQFRTAEGFFAVWATLAGTTLLRTHEVPQVRAVVTTMRDLSIEP